MINLLCRFVNWVLFLIRNAGRNPAYPFDDDCIDKPLKCQPGPWGSTQWLNPADGNVYVVNTVDDIEAIAESIERDILYFCQAEESLKEWPNTSIPPHVIRFLKPLKNTG